MVPTSVLASLVVSAILATLWPVAIFLICRRRMKLLIRNVLIGAGVFFLFSQVLEKGLHVYLLKVNLVTAAWFPLHPLEFALYGCVAAGLFEEVGRYLAMRFLVKGSGNPGTAVAYGLGHGGIEAILIGSVAAVQTIVFASMLNSGQLDSALGPVLDPVKLAQLRAGLEHLSSAGAAMGSLERLIALLIQIGLSLLVWRAVKKRHLGFLALAILLHALIDFPAGLFQVGQMPVFWVEGLLLVVGAALAGFFLYELPRKPPALQEP